MKSNQWRPEEIPGGAGAEATGRTARTGKVNWRLSAMKKTEPADTLFVENWRVVAAARAGGLYHCHPMRSHSMEAHAPTGIISLIRSGTSRLYPPAPEAARCNRLHPATARGST